jgi:hypothetical protein
LGRFPGNFKNLLPKKIAVLGSLHLSAKAQSEEKQQVAALENAWLSNRPDIAEITYIEAVLMKVRFSSREDEAL